MPLTNMSVKSCLVSISADPSVWPCGPTLWVLVLTGVAHSQMSNGKRLGASGAVTKVRELMMVTLSS